MGWNGSGSGNADGDAARRPAGRSSNGAARGLVAGLAVVAGAAACWLLLTGREEPQPERPDGGERGLIAEVAPAAAPANAPAAEEAACPAEAEDRVVSVRTNRDGAVVSDVVTPDGRRKRIVRTPQPVWDSAADQLIAMAVSIVPGQTAAPLPSGITDRDFREALKRDIADLPGDTERVRELKRRVREARGEILELMEGTGRGFEEIVREYREDMNAGTEAYHDAVRGLAEVRRSGTAEDVRAYVAAMNEALRKAGARELPSAEGGEGDGDASPAGRRGRNGRKGEERPE